MIYIVEDDENIRELVQYTLRQSGFEAAGFPDAEHFWKAMDAEKPELILLDIMLPGEDGISILRKLRASSATKEVPVIMTTAKGEEIDKVTGLDYGADDYLVKPFGLMEMASRVRAVLRRSHRDEMKLLTAGTIEMDPIAHTAHVHGDELELTLKEYNLLHLFLEQPGRVFTREDLLSAVWGTEYAGETRTVDVHIATLRGKLGDEGRRIGTVRGVGYRFEG